MPHAHENLRQPRLILVGGFLGAGKTSLLWEAARRLARRGDRVGLITNDQAPDLVDTALLSGTEAGVREVAGSCFCCNFPGFIEAVESLAKDGATCILAEPVGSCTDLSATILQPLKDRYPQYALAPLSVLVDAARVREVFQRDHPLLHPDAAYILRLQLEEADQILLSKCDQLTDAERDDAFAFLRAEFPHLPVSTLASHTGEGVDAWLDGMASGQAAGARVVAVDYDRYAHGEAVLGWLNAVVDLRWLDGLAPEWTDFLNDLFQHLHAALREAGVEVGHIKMLLDTPEGSLAANLVGLHDDVRLRTEGSLSRLSARLTINARAQISPEGIESAIRHALAHAAHGRVSPHVRTLHCLQPGRPVPTHRYTGVVA